MKPLLLQFKEFPPIADPIDFSQILYDQRLNLSVNRLTGRPAIDESGLETATHTRITGEETDSDRNRVDILMATETHTKSGEGTDSDPYRLDTMLATATTTFVTNEGTDSDK